MNRLLTILLLAAGTAYGQIDNPPTSADIADATATGRSLLTAASPAAGRGVLGGTPFGGSIFAGTSASARPTLIASILGFSVTNNLGFDASLTNFWTATNAATAATAIGLGATNNVNFNQLTATGNVTLSGVNNTMPGATTADSASSLMTRDLVGQEFANPRRKLQTTYWFGIEGLGEWSTIGTSAVSAYVSGGGNGFGGGRAFYSTTRVGLNHAGAGLRLGADNNYGGSPYRVSDGGPLTMRANIRKQSVVERQAIAFLMGIRTATQLWQQSSYGLYFVPQPTNVWTSNGVVTQHSRIAVSNVVWSVNTAGTNDTTEPAWTDLIGSLVTNGSAVYRNLGPHTSNNWVLAIGSTNASQVVMTNTGKEGPQNINRAEVVLKLRSDGTTNTPYTIYGSVENAAGESSEVSLTTTNTEGRQPQFWSRFDEESGTTNVPADPMIRYFSIDAVIPSLF